MNSKGTIEESNIYTKPAVVVVLAVISTLLWGSAFPCIKIGYEMYRISADDLFTKVLFAGYRFFIAGVMVILIASVMKKTFILPNKKNIKGILILGFVQTTLQYAFFYIGVAHTTGVKSSILYSVNTFIAVILAHFFYKDDRIDGRKAIGCLLGFGGVILINLGSGSMGGGFTFSGDGMMILAAAAFGVSALLNKNISKTGDSATLTGYQLLIGGGFLVIMGLAGGGSIELTVSLNAMLMLGYLALLSAVSFTIWAVLLKYNGVGKITIFNFLIPVFGVLLSAIFLDESVFEPRSLVALALVCSGIVVINLPKGNSLSK